ncbi:hypothetical protein Pmar_PMAR011682 [Perkinsus marinus ATCC 50983]|uniref:Uncharacterized protein n=1 Tax=Perkinsus marinus (strain ATCC 50983 / TXsc) TaxID=423536 RepID=C5LCH1_PERM5|nr:hypothetical protein Pmar_PMAR011682 [Perkinsus marinus ATCC 50983]EER05654.1 hypothetical protein Pmar_PMAR011682 [Perkinsus marinus ATCC 50983]|eukprot:XP_002773838.1 hypothetical protein Pmar_PMAR011682 [Perkinsus marinus ATCC 50983]
MGASSSSPSSSPPSPTPPPTEQDLPCQPEMDAFVACVKAKPEGLRATDCEELRDRYKLCMVEYKATKDGSVGKRG